ncbi:MAG TPA: prolyl oligopeptidase family serine peptidase [Pirellulaceae bacterium]|nr:prolyl oligopeptidase family serine peptidase [Pirellulaceae bacterium]
MLNVLRVLFIGFVSCVLGGMMANANGADVAVERFEMRVFESEQGSLPYRLLRPKNYDASRRYPLVIFYHGAGERGDDNVKQLVHGMNDLASDDVMDKYPCFVIAPQCPDEDQWVDTPWTADAHQMPEKPTEPMRLSLELMTSLQSEFSIDEDRLYVTGLSMGGFGVWDAIQRHPHRFAAALPICSGGDPVFAKHIAHIPIWAFHGDADPAVKPKRSQDMVAALKAAGGSPKYTEYPGVGHNSWTATYANREVYAWLFAQQRPARVPD